MAAGGGGEKKEDGGVGEYNPYGFEGELLEKLEELKRRTEDVVCVPEWRRLHRLKRFLDARSGDLDGAEKQYRKAMKFRQDVGADGILERFSEPEAVKYFASNFLGPDHDGYAVLLEKTGTADLVGLNAAVGDEGFLRWVTWYHEVQEGEMDKASEASGALRDKLTVLVDLGGLSMSMAGSATLSVLQRRTRMEEANYPEVVRRVLIINAPSLFSGLWSVIQYFLDEGTRNKLRFFSSRSDWEPEIKKLVPDSSLPGFLGGSVAIGGDPNCPGLLRAGGEVPARFYGSPSGHASATTIPAGKRATLRIKLAPNEWAQLSWVSSTGYDIDVEARFIPDAGEPSKEGDEAAEGREPLVASNGLTPPRTLPPKLPSWADRVAAAEAAAKAGADKADAEGAKKDETKEGPEDKWEQSGFRLPFVLSVGAEKAVHSVGEAAVDREKLTHGAIQYPVVATAEVRAEGEDEPYFSPIGGRSATEPWGPLPSSHAGGTLVVIFDNSASWVREKVISGEAIVWQQP